MKVLTLLQAKARIAELESELETLKVQAASVEAPDASAQIAEAVKAATEGLEKSLADANVEVARLNAELASSKVEKADFDAEVAKQSALTVAQVTGRNPLNISEGESAPGEAKSVRDEYLALKKTDPMAAGRFWKAHIKELRVVAG